MTTVTEPEVRETLLDVPLAPLRPDRKSVV